MRNTCGIKIIITRKEATTNAVPLKITLMA